MNIYYTGMDGTRRLSDCNLSESEVSSVKATDGVDTFKMYMIFNTAVGEDALITFGGKKQIPENLRDVFWRCIAKHRPRIFDVDEWYGNIKFVTPKAVRKNKKKRI